MRRKGRRGEKRNEEEEEERRFCLRYEGFACPENHQGEMYIISFSVLNGAY